MALLKQISVRKKRISDSIDRERRLVGNENEALIDKIELIKDLDSERDEIVGDLYFHSY